jgi:hypothetical protein
MLGSNLVETVKRPLLRIRADYRELTGQLRGLPSVLIVGAQKAGTTSLFNYMVQHPDVLAPMSKEIHYFDLNYAKGIGWYRARFPYSYRLRNGSVTLDASPYYLFHPLVPERAARQLPQVKLIALLRNPIDRAYSHYQHEVRGGRESLSFAEAIRREPERLAGEEQRLRSDPGYYSYNHHRYSYALRGRYLEQLRRWVACYSREQLLVLQSEWLFQEPAAASKAVYEFLGLSPHLLDGYKPYFQGDYKREIPAEVRILLAAYFEPHNRELYQWLGQEYDWS